MCCLTWLLGPQDPRLNPDLLDHWRTLYSLDQWPASSTHHHHVMPLARISLTLSRHFSLSFITSGRSSELHPISSNSCCIYVQAGHPAFAQPYVGVHRSTSLMSSSLLLQQCPACLVHLTLIVFVIGGRWLFSSIVTRFTSLIFLSLSLDGVLAKNPQKSFQKSEISVARLQGLAENFKGWLSLSPSIPITNQFWQLLQMVLSICMELMCLYVCCLADTGVSTCCGPHENFIPASVVYCSWSSFYQVAHYSWTWQQQIWQTFVSKKYNLFYLFLQFATYVKSKREG